MKTSLAAILTALLATSAFACSSDDPIDAEGAGFGSDKADSALSEGSAAAAAVLQLVNTASEEELDDDAGLNSRAAGNIIDHRNGADGQLGTADDDPYDDLQELDDVPFVGPVALQALLDYAKEKGLLPEGDAQASVIFSPQALDDSHNARIAQMIDQAQESVDIAMYSFSSADISDALEAAVARGVKVRFIFETARAKDKKLTGSALESSKSGRLEAMGVDVRYVNKIMHHKFIMVDGPQESLDQAANAKIASGSANWSTGGATVYDENTLFISGVPEMALKMQQEFNLMWDHSTDLVINPNIQTHKPSLTIEDADIPDQPDLDIHLTSKNFDVSEGSTSFRLRSRQDMEVSDAWVDAIENATDSIWVASGHMRLRPVAEALIAKKQANPNMDIRVYLDQQEYVSFSGDTRQKEKMEECVAAATNDNKVFDCENKSFLWGKAIGESGIDVRYKTYAFRWHFSYAVQMHNKFMLIDGDELYSGSYNLSINAEHGTFENTMHLEAPTFAPVIEEYTNYFEEVFELNRDNGTLDALRDEIATAQDVPLVFDSMALTHQEVTSLKGLIRDNCAQIFSDDFRKNPQNHRTCPR